jgi:hypothetical protein
MEALLQVILAQQHDENHIEAWRDLEDEALNDSDEEEEVDVEEDNDIDGVQDGMGFWMLFGDLSLAARREELFSGRNWEGVGNRVAQIAGMLERREEESRGPLEEMVIGLTRSVAQLREVIPMFHEHIRTATSFLLLIIVPTIGGLP